MLLGFSVCAFALTAHDVENTCPLNGLKFTQLLPASGTSFGMMLDFRPIGPISSPWTQAECPEDGLVLYKEFTPEEVRVLAEYVPATEYQTLRKHAQYWRIAHLQKTLGDPLEERASVLIQATWEAATPQQYEEYAKASLEAYQELVATQKDNSSEFVTSQLIIGELHRRLSSFDTAKSVFTQLQKNAACQKAEICTLIVKQQLRLIEQKDSGNKEVERQ